MRLHVWRWVCWCEPLAKKERKTGAPATQRESDDNSTVFARCVTSSRGGTLVHCASGLIVWIKENIIKTFPHAHAIKQREEERGGETALMDNQFRPPCPYTLRTHTHKQQTHTLARHAFSWDDILYISTESTIDGSCLSNADGVNSSWVALQRPQGGMAAEVLIVAWISWAVAFSGSGRQSFYLPDIQCPQAFSTIVACLQTIMAHAQTYCVVREGQENNKWK